MPPSEEAKTFVDWYYEARHTHALENLFARLRTERGLISSVPVWLSGVHPVQPRALLDGLRDFAAAHGEFRPSGRADRGRGGGVPLTVTLYAKPTHARNTVSPPLIMPLPLRRPRCRP